MAMRALDKGCRTTLCRRLVTCRVLSSCDELRSTVELRNGRDQGTTKWSVPPSTITRSVVQQRMRHSGLDISKQHRVIARNVRPRSVRRLVSAARSTPTLPDVVTRGPDASFNWRALVAGPTRRVVSERYPELLDLVEDGTLVAWPRPASYAERREDGYAEPELLLLVGTAHVSRRSAADVARVIQAAHPDAVVVELCRSRSGVMSEPAPPQAAAATASQGSGDEEPEEGRTAPAGVLSLTAGRAGEGFVGAMRRSAGLGGQSGLLLRVLLARVAASGSGALRVSGGAEFLAARRAADAVDAQLVLGDRPIEISLQRAWDALGWAQQARLVTTLLSAALSASPKTLDEALVERLKRDDALTAFTAALAATFPELLAPLVHERDAYLAWSLKRSKAVNGARRVVGVMGAGHLRGVVYALSQDNGGDILRFSDLVGNLNRRSEQRKRASAAARRLAVELALGVAGYAAWLHWQGSGGLAGLGS